MIKLFKKLYSDEEGQGLAEYGLILALIAVVCIAALVLLGNTISNKLGKVQEGLTTS
ncbi:MAG: Flp family type IVb pilin [Eubacteriales bacterium]